MGEPPSVAKHLGDAAAPSTTPSNRTSLAIADGSAADSPQDANASPPDRSAGTPSKSDDTIASHNYNFGEVVVANISSSLESVDDRVFNRFNIKAVLTKGQRNMNPKTL